ncbi:topoisomerase [Yersinia phage vB_Yru_GN1]|uniref:Topoisomerase n=1 Tax=Yersinia phage vB_Yru_GN1 TaxID=3074381 RepID=A0AA86JHR1_9CAUD|nr:topoisomerase [Yersinia phage vB_Yru_GN1]
MSEVNQLIDQQSESIYDLVSDGYAKYQMFVNNGKFIPGLDGLKTVYRRYLLSVKDSAKSSYEKSSLVLGNAMKWHPHETQEDVLYSLVRWGLVQGQGNFGLRSHYRKLTGAAIRYTEVKYLNAVDSLLFKFENYFNYLDGESGRKEPEFLITPIPIALYRGSIGIGVGGVRTKIPAFSYESILEAYQNNDPTLLKSAYGLDIDYDNSTLNTLWTKGHGKVVLKFKVEKLPNGSTRIYGDCGAGVRPKLDQLFKWEKQGLLKVSNDSTESMDLVFTRANNIRKISDKDIYQEVLKASVIDDVRATYIIMFSHDGRAVKMGMKKWIDLTMGIYNKTFLKWKEMELKKLNRTLIRTKLIPVVGEMLRQGKSTAQIAKELNTPETPVTKKTIAAIEGLPMRLLRKSDFSSTIKKIEDQIKSIESTVLDDLVQSGKMVDQLLNKY